MIYKGHDIRIERGHIRVTEMKTGSSWTEDTITEAKRVIDVTNALLETPYKIDPERGLTYED